jgi:hypothetical protein
MWISVNYTQARDGCSVSMGCSWRDWLKFKKLWTLRLSEVEKSCNCNSNRTSSPLESSTCTVLKKQVNQPRGVLRAESFSNKHLIDPFFTLIKTQDFRWFASENIPYCHEEHLQPAINSQHEWVLIGHLHAYCCPLIKDEVNVTHNVDDNFANLNIWRINIWYCCAK